MLFLSSTGAAVVAVLLATAVAPRLGRRTRRQPAGRPRAAPPRVYAFRDGELISPRAPRDPLLPPETGPGEDWAGLAEVLGRMNPAIRPALADLAARGRGFVLTGRAGSDPVTVSGAADGATLRIVVAPVGEGPARPEPDAPPGLDGAGIRAARAEEELLRRTADAIPVVAWREDAEGTITWANAGYFARLAEQDAAAAGDGGASATGGLRWPPRQIFGEGLRPLPDPGQSRRVALDRPAPAGPAWYELSTRPVGEETLVTAMPAERLVAAENDLRDFVQTLSKTFADLPIGLAIFDRRRELVLFNPAMVSLSTLSGQFLSARPTLLAFLDALREARQMPEPRNYKSWRESIAKLEADAEEGTYHDLWTLPMGQTYRVIGRPHPDGAIAFMFEDISSEVSLTRQFRAELALYQAVVDQDPLAVAVFSAQGQLVLSNAAYADLWGHDPRELLGALPIAEATQRWAAATCPAPLWGEIRDCVNARQDRAAFSDRLPLPGGGTLFAGVTPLPGGATMLRFEIGAGRTDALRRDGGAEGPVLRLAADAGGEPG